MMSVEAFENDLKNRLQRQPFQPFVVERIDGLRLKVLKPKMLWYPLGGKSAIFFWEDGNMDFVDCAGVSRIDDLNEPAAA
jgi:hypothetical protein